MSVVANVMDVSRSNLHERLKGSAKPRPNERGRYNKVQDAAMSPQIQRLAAERPTYGYPLAGRRSLANAEKRRITALLNRAQRADGLDTVNHKRVYRIMAKHGLLLAQRRRDLPERPHDGKVVSFRSILRWRSDGFEFRCWNGIPVRVAFILDTHDREAIAWRAVAGAGISGSDVRDVMLEAVERRLGHCRAPEPIEMLSDNGSAYTARETRIFAVQIGVKSCFTPVASPEGNGVAEAFVRAMKRYFVRVSPLPDAAAAMKLIAGWFED